MLGFRRILGAGKCRYHLMFDSAWKIMLCRPNRKIAAIQGGHIFGLEYEI